MQYICIDIGGTSIKYGIIDQNFNIIFKNSMPTEAHLGKNGILDKIFNIIEKCKSQCNPKGVCISTAGMVDCEKGSIIYANELIPNYTGTNIKDEVEKKYNIPCEVENDVNCAGLAEANKGAGINSKTCFCLTVGTGIGGCILLNGKIFRGSGGAGCIGYLPINNNKFESLAAASVLTRNIAQRKNLENISGEKVFSLYEQGDKICKEELEKMINCLSIGISSICYIISPDTIIIGGGIMARFDIIEPLLNQALNKNIIPEIRKNVILKCAKFKNDAGMIGALCNFLQRN